MENRLILLDTSILIDMFRRKVRENSFFYQLANNYQYFAVSTITRFEILVGNNEIQNSFWSSFYKNIEIIDFNDNCAMAASNIVKQLKSKNQMIEIADIFIGGTALAYNLPLATLNKNHFSRIENLEIL